MIKEITESNATEYSGKVPAELLADIGREYIKALAGEDAATNAVKAVVFWELKNTENTKKPTEAELLWFYAADSENGAELLDKLVQSMMFEGIKRFFYEQPELSEAEMAALKECGFTVSNAESRDIYVTLEELSSLKFVKKKIPSYISMLSDISYRRFKAAIVTSVYNGKYGLLDDLPYLAMSRFNIDVSSCVITDDKVNGLLLVHETESGQLRVELLFALQPDANVHLLYMICNSIKKACSLYSSNKKVILRRHNKATFELIKKLFPDKKGDVVFRGEKRIS